MFRELSETDGQYSQEGLKQGHQHIKNCDRKFKLPVEKWKWSRWGENYNVPLNQKQGLLLWFGGGCCFEDVGALMCSLAAGHRHIYCEEIHVISFMTKKDIYPRKLFQNRLCTKHHTWNDILLEFLFTAFKCIIGLLNSSLEANLLRTTTRQKKPVHAEQQA